MCVRCWCVSPSAMGGICSSDQPVVQTNGTAPTKAPAAAPAAAAPSADPNAAKAQQAASQAKAQAAAQAQATAHAQAAKTKAEADARTAQQQQAAAAEAAAAMTPEQKPPQPIVAAAAAAPAAAAATTDGPKVRAALDIQFEMPEPNAKENEAKEDPNGSDIDAHVEYGRLRGVTASDIANASELKEVGLRAAGDHKSPNANPLFETEDTAVGEKFGATRPWLGALKAPSRMPEGMSARAPDQNLTIDWVYGYRGYDSRNNVFLNSDGHVLYPTAALVVKLDIKNRKQTYFMGHNDDVVCVAQCPTNPDLFASGQVATIEKGRAVAPHICIWDGKTMKTLAVIPKAAQRAVRAIAISPAGKYVASVGDDNDFSVTVWTITGTKLATLSGDKDPNKIFGITWKNEYEFVTCGVKHICFWKFDNSTKLVRTKGKCAGKFEMQTFYTATWTAKGYCAVATRDGGVYIFKDGVAAFASTGGHKGAVYMILGVPEGLLTGGRDGSVVLWDNSMKKIQNWNFASPIRAFDVTPEGRMVVGTERSELFEVPNYTRASGAAPVLLSRGHWDGELWAIDTEPRGMGFATAGEDNKLIVWDHVAHQFAASSDITDRPGKARKRERAATTSSHPANACARSIRYNADGSHVAIGTNDGELAVYETRQLSRVAFYDLNKYAKQNIAKKWGNWIQTLKYSPDGKYLAVGTHGSVIVLCDVANGYAPIELKTKSGSLEAHNSALLQLDWSKDSKHMRSNCRAYELLFWNIGPNVKDAKQEGSASAMRDVQWADPSCPFSWGTMGIFDPSQTGTDINAVDVHPDGTLLATSDDYGRVNLFRYPAVPPANYKDMPTNKAPAQQCEKKSFGGHASHAQSLRWSPDGKYLFSVGGNDKTIIQWILS